MASYRQIQTGTAGASTPDFYTEFAHDLRDWFNVKSRVTVQLEDPGIATGTPPPASASSDWGPRFNAVLAEIEQVAPIEGGIIECYPEQKKISTTVELGGGTSGLHHITIRSSDLAVSGVFAGKGHGASFYTGTSGMTMFKHSPGTNVNHWGPTFEGITFASGDFPTNTTLVLLENVNMWGFRNCSWLYGNIQLKVDARLDLGGGNDASWGQINRANFLHYNSRAIQMPSGMGKVWDVNFAEGGSGSWAMEFGPDSSQGTYGGFKVDGPGNGIWNKGHSNRFWGLSLEGCMVHLRQDKDVSVSHSGSANEYHGLQTSFRNQAGEVGIDVTSNVDALSNAVYGWTPWGTVGAGGAALQDTNNRMSIITHDWFDGGGPLIKLTQRSATPAAPGTNGAFLYFRGGAWRVRVGSGAEQTITVT